MGFLFDTCSNLVQWDKIENLKFWTTFFMLRFVFILFLSSVATSVHSVIKHSTKSGIMNLQCFCKTKISSFYKLGDGIDTCRCFPLQRTLNTADKIRT